MAKAIKIQFNAQNQKEPIETNWSKTQPIWAIKSSNW